MTFIAYPITNELNYLILEDMPSRKQAKKLAMELLASESYIHVSKVDE